MAAMLTSRLAGFALLSLLTVWSGVAAQGPSRLEVHASVKPSTASPGDEVVVSLFCEIEVGYHIYGAKNPTDPTSIVFGDLPGLEPVGEPVVPDGELHEAFGQASYWIEPVAELSQRFRVTADAVTGPLLVHGEVHYMACTPEFCDPPAQEPFSAELIIKGGVAPGSGEVAAEVVLESGPTEVGDPVDGASGSAAAEGGAASVVQRQPTYSLDGGASGGGLWSLILLCIGGGLIALVLPCTYPMIPITFSFFTKQADARGGKVLPLALAYGAGIVLIFIAIGVLVGPIIIEFASHWVTNLVIGTAFVLFAFVLFGWINLQPPKSVMAAAGKASNVGGLLGVFLMGATLVVTSFTCTAPIVGSLLAGVAQGGVSTFEVAIGMGVFGLTMATPFVLLALLPGKVKQMPSSGEWMNTLKVSLGFIELAAALKFFSNVDIVLDWKLLPREAFLFVWAFMFALMALYLFGALRGAAQLTSPSRLRNASGIAVLALSFYCVAGASGLRLDFVMTAFEPPYQIRSVDEHVIVKDDHQAAAALAREQKKYLLVNFTGFN